jgi:prepilin-type N-terminal cleavage/methylation domain-containing protein
MFRFSPKTQGFTLLEVLVVTSLLIILALFGFGAFQSNLMKTRDSRRKADLTELRKAFYSFHDDHDRYPLFEEFECGMAFEPYMERIPCDPSNNDTYRYVHSTDLYGSFFRITADLETGGSFEVSSENVDYGMGSEEEGEEPTCGIAPHSCIPGICSQCCPGANYICNAKGTRCIFDAACGLTPTP